MMSENAKFGGNMVLATQSLAKLEGMNGPRHEGYHPV